MKNNKTSRFFNLLYTIFGIPCLFMMIVTSRGFTLLKIILLAIVVLISFIEIFAKGTKLNKTILCYFAVFIAYYMSSLLLGIMKGYEFSIANDFALLQYFLITPLSVLIIYIAFKGNYERISKMLILIDFITLFVVLMDLLKILAHQGLILDIDIFNLIMIASDNTSANELTLRTSNEFVLMYLMPYYIVRIFDKSSHRKKKRMYWLIVFLGSIYMLFSGRKTLEFVSIMTVIMMMSYALIVQKRIKILIIAFIVIIIGGILINKFGSQMGIDSVLLYAIRTFFDGIESSAKGVSKRSSNFFALIEMWYNSPIIGNGLNSYARESLANGYTKWSYEIVYVALLAQTGIIGIIIFFSGVFSLVKESFKMYRNSKNNLFMAAGIGFGSFILCGATNPLAYVIWPWVLTMLILSISYSKKY